MTTATQDDIVAGIAAEAAEDYLATDAAPRIAYNRLAAANV